MILPFPVYLFSFTSFLQLSVAFLSSAFTFFLGDRRSLVIVRVFYSSGQVYNSRNDLQENLPTFYSVDFVLCLVQPFVGDSGGNKEGVALC